MRVAVFSDIHGNLPALEAIVEDIKTHSVDRVICLGDTIAIGPSSKECLELIMQSDITMVLGNHELYYLLGSESVPEEEALHQRWVASLLGKEETVFLKQCCLEMTLHHERKRLLFVHFPLRLQTRSELPFYDLEIMREGNLEPVMEAIAADYIFIGHDHRHVIHESKGKMLVDIGSSGCRKDPFTSYYLIDLEDEIVLSKQTIPYDHPRFLNILKSTPYPDREFVAEAFFGCKL